MKYLDLTDKYDRMFKNMKPTPEQIAKLPKWAQEHLADIQRDARIKSALRWTEPVERDIKPPENSSVDLSIGWNFSGSWQYGHVEKACSSSWVHGSGWEKTT